MIEWQLVFEGAIIATVVMLHLSVFGYLVIMIIGEHIDESERLRRR